MDSILRVYILFSSLRFNFDFSSIDLFLICPAMDSDMMGRSRYRKENGKAFWKCPAGLDMCSLLS